MLYEIYSLPGCGHCHEAIELMGQKSIHFEEVNIGVSEGIKRLRKFYTEHKDEIKRDSSGSVLLPITVYNNNGTTRIHQGREGLENFLVTL
jgi:glutaredoxin